MEKFRLSCYCVFTTIGKTTVFMSQWCVLQAFVQATMWHSTEPRTLGISYWAAGLFLGAICGPGLFYLPLSVGLSTTKLRSAEAHLWITLTSFFARIIPALGLWISSLPGLDTMPEVRTWLLGCAVVFINLYFITVAWTPGHRCSGAHRPFNTATDDPGEVCRSFRGLPSSPEVAGDVLTAACATMGARWWYGSINLFYESWKGSSVLVLIAILYATALVFWEIRMKKGFFSKLFPVKWKSSKSDDNVVPNARCKILPDVEKLHERHCGVDGVGDKYSTLSAQSTATGDADSSLAQPTDNDLERMNGLHPSSPCLEDRAASGNGVAADVRRSSCSSASICYALFYAFILAFANGSLGYFFLWIFTSPNVLCSWGEVSDDPADYVIYGCFSLGCLLAIVTNVEKVCILAEDESCMNNNEKSGARRWKHLSWVVHIFLSGMMASGCGVILHANGATFIFGASILSAASPLILRMVLVMSYDLVLTTKSRQTTRSRLMATLPAVLMMFSGLTFVTFHFLGVMFINPQLTSMVHGNMGAILWPQVTLAIFPLFCGPLLRRKVTFSDRLRSPSTGPLLEPRLPNLARQAAKRKHSKVLEHVQAKFERHRIRKHQKISNIFFVLLLLVVFSASKYVSVQSKRNCGVSGDVTHACDASKDGKKPGLRVMTWNILLGHTMTGRSNLEDIARITDEYDPHVLALQEATGHPPYWGGKDVFGYLKSTSKSCRVVGEVVNPRVGSLEVGMLSKLEVTAQSSMVLPGGGEKKLPSYTMAKISCRVLPLCNVTEEQGSGFEHYQPRLGNTLHVYTLHAVYKNWTCDRQSRLSCDQMRLVHDDIALIPEDEPVIVMGDFNINPSEPELDIWFQSHLGFKSALWPERSIPTRKDFNYTCDVRTRLVNEACDCTCKNKSSDPPKSTLLNRKAAVDHIFYRGLELVERAKILDKVGDISDHYPVLADFVFR